jgi:hypothetical protein
MARPGRPISIGIFAIKKSTANCGGLFRSNLRLAAVTAPAHRFSTLSSIVGEKRQGVLLSSLSP